VSRENNKASKGGEIKMRTSYDEMDKLRAEMVPTGTGTGRAGYLTRMADHLFRTVDTLEPSDLFASEDWSDPLPMPTGAPLFASEAVNRNDSLYLFDDGLE
jgi:hypothetical protein|tara:strand:+ start:11730 stop:12032 length:303 start_codon:yes stop_codon:yes gene_type:complete